jgi:hypothetical protein
MPRLRIFGSGRVLLEDKHGRVLEDFVVADVEKAQQIVMKYMQGKKKERDEKTKT